MKKSLTDPTGQDITDDAALFRETVGEVNPLAKQNLIKPPVPARKAYTQPYTSATPIPDNLSDFMPGDVPPEYTRNGVSRQSLRKLKRGTWPVQDNLDLHGSNRSVARKLLQEFLHEAINHEMRCVLVIHGKGINSLSGESVLKTLTRHWLSQHPNVLGYCDAMPKQGGSGAVLILLKNKA